MLASCLQGLPVAMLAEAAQAPIGFLDLSGLGEERPPFAVDGDVGIVAVSGPTFQHALTLFGFTLADGYDAIGARLRDAFGADDVGAVQLHINSPGGVCVGGHELMLDMRAMATESGKPLDVWVNGSAYSMAMWLSAGAGQIFLPPSAGLGSIGVVSTAANVSGALAAAGIVPIVAADPDEKIYNHGAQLLPPDGEHRARMQANVTAMMDLFADAISDARGLTPAEVRGLKARTFMGRAAVDARLADAVTGKREAIERTRAKIKRKAYSMPEDQGKVSRPRGEALVKLLGLAPNGYYTDELIERAASDRLQILELGAHVMRETGAENHADAREIFGLYKDAHASLPTVQTELKIRETQLAVSTGRLLPKDAYALEEGEREYPALPALHPEIAAKGLAVLRARFSASSALPETMRKGEPRKASPGRRITETEREGAKRAGMSEADYTAWIARYDNTSSATADDEEIDE